MRVATARAATPSVRQQEGATQVEDAHLLADEVRGLSGRSGARRRRTLGLGSSEPDNQGGGEALPLECRSPSGCGSPA